MSCNKIYDSIVENDREAGYVKIGPTGKDIALVYIVSEALSMGNVELVKENGTVILYQMDNLGGKFVSGVVFQDGFHWYGAQYSGG